MVFTDEVSGKREEVWFSGSIDPVVLSKEFADVQESHDQKVKGFKAGFFDGKPSVAIGGVPTLYLNSDLRQLVIGWPMAWIRMDADQIVALVVCWSLVGKDIPTHEVTHDEELGTG